MFLSIGSIIQIFVIIALFLVVLILVFSLFRAILIRNKEIKIIKFDSSDQNEIDYYLKKLFELIEIKTSSFEDDEAYHVFREKLKEQFPNVHNYFQKEKIKGNAIFTYKEKIEGAPNILLATHVDYKSKFQETRYEDEELFGNCTFDGKSLLFTIFEAVERSLSIGKLKVNLTIVMTTDDTTTKDGASSIVRHFLKKGKFFDLVLEEGSGIVDPIFLGLKSYYALIGIGVTGEAIVRFKTNKVSKGEARLKEFVKSIEDNGVFKAKIDRKSYKPLKEIAKDMSFCERLYFNNLFLFRSYAKKKINEEYLKLSKLLKTQIIYGEITENHDECYVDLTFELSTHTDTADIILALANNMEKYAVEYEIISNKESSKVTRVDDVGYKVINKAVKKVFKNLYTAPIIITQISEKRYFDKVSDCVIRFSPLYYPHQAYKDAMAGNEHVPIKSIIYGIRFFEEILNTYIRR